AICHGRDGFSALIRTTAVPAGDATCAHKGVRIEVGVDDGVGTAGDGVLDDAEVDDTSMICNGADGAAGMPGADGAAGADGKDGVDGAASGCTTSGSATGLLAGIVVLLMAGPKRDRGRRWTSRAWP